MEAAIHNVHDSEGEACSSERLKSCLKYWIWLFVFGSFLVSADRVHAAQKDTITVDGVPLELELAISNSGTQNVLPEGKGKVKRGRATSPDICFGLGSGWVYHPTNAFGERLANYIGQGSRWSLHVPMAAEWQDGKRLVRVELGAEHYRDWAYDSALLDDSLFQLAPDENGGVEQWVAVNVGDLGIELDTLPLPTFLYAASSATLAVCLGSTAHGGRPSDRNAHHRWWVGVHGRWAWDQRTERHVNRIPEGMMPSPSRTEGAERNDWEANRHFVWGLQAGMSRGIRRTPLEWMVSGQLVAGPRPRWSCIFGMQYRWSSNRR